MRSRGRPSGRREAAAGSKVLKLSLINVWAPSTSILDVWARGLVTETHRAPIFEAVQNYVLLFSLNQA